MKATTKISGDFLRHLIAAVPYKMHTVLTDNGIHFTTPGAGGSADAFGIADAALFYLKRWAPEVEVDLPPNIAAHFNRAKTQPAVAKVTRLWGEG